MNDSTFPGFRYPADELSAYAVTCDVFILYLKNHTTAYLYTSSSIEFRAWLKKNKISDVSATIGNKYARVTRAQWSIKNIIRDVFNYH